MWLTNPKAEWERKSRFYHTDGLQAIYRITCLANGKHYVGSAVDLNRRWRNHRKALAKGTHGNPKLQSAYNKYGPDQFEWAILECVPNKEFLIAKEQSWLDALKAAERKYGFNISPTAGSTLGLKMSEEFKEEKRRRMLGNKHTLGHKLTEEHKAKIGVKLKGGNLQEGHKKKIGESVSQEWWVKLPDGREYVVKSLQAFCRKHGLPFGVLYAIACGGGPRGKKKGWDCIRLSEPRRKRDV